MPAGETGNARWCGPKDIPPIWPARSQEPGVRSQDLKKEIDELFLVIIKIFIVFVRLSV